MLSTLDHLIHAADCGKSTLLVSLDLSAAFDTIDHNILLNRLHHSFGISGSVHQWLESYLVGRTQFVRLGSFTSDPVDLTCGVPQGSVLGPLLFTIYTSPISHITSSYGVNQQQYADDTQLFITLSPGDHLNEIANLESCLQSLSIWFSLNGLALNSSKSESALFGTKQRSHSYSDVMSVAVADSVIPLAADVKILGATIDEHLSMNKHVTAVCRSSYYHLRALRHIRQSLTDDMARAVGSSVVGARIDYANSILYGVSQYNIQRLQRVQNALARVVSATDRTLSSRHILHSLHWLPVQYRINYKLSLMTFNTLHHQEPQNLATCLSYYRPVRALRSSDDPSLLTVPRQKLSIASRGFRVAAPTLWNSLPRDIRESDSVSSFRRRLKTFYFNSAFNP